MIMKITFSVIVFKFSVVFLFPQESFFPTTIRQVSRSSGGVFPVLICQVGFRCYTIGSVSQHINRVIIYDVSSSKLGNEFHVQIWDPGISNLRSDDRTMKCRLMGIVHPCFLLSKRAVTVLFLTNLRVWQPYSREDTFLSALVLGYDLIQVWMLYDDEGDACKSRGFAISILVSAVPLQPFHVNGFRSRQWFVQSPNGDRNCIILKKRTRPEKNNGLGRHDDFLFLRIQCNGGNIFADSRSGFIGTLETEFIITTEQQWIGCYISHDPDTFQATYQCFNLTRVMRKALGSFIYKVLALYKYMKRGLNRFYLLPVRLLLESRVTSTSSSKLGFNFLYLFQWLYLKVLRYHVSCNTFMK